MTEDIIIQFFPEKQDKNQISEEKFQNLSKFDLKFSNATDFETKLWKSVRFWFENFTARQLLDKKK